VGYDLADKIRRGACQRHDCDEPASSYVLYKCAAGHRCEIRRCPGHIQEAMSRALSGSVYPVCEECPPWTAYMLPVFERP